MNNLRNLRKKKGLSLKKLHEMTGYPLRSLEDWDSDSRLITSYHRIKKLSEILGCSTDEFMTKEEKCKYGDNEECTITLIQGEDGVHITLLDNDTFDEIRKEVMSRESALKLLKIIRKKEDIKPFIDSIIY